MPLNSFRSRHFFDGHGTKYLLIFFLFSCGSPLKKDTNSTDQLAEHEEIANFMNQFEGRGQQSDESELPLPKATLASFENANDIEVELVLSEPLVNQPVEINFDHRGRMWVVQYSQYPHPKGLKVTGIDHHIRMTFDKKPEPPPVGVEGADKITFYEDTNGDGVYDKATDAITGLNIATSVTWGRQKIWVLNPPYLLAYPDPDEDGIPNGDPTVHIDGFGLEDTHAVANSLRWGPDGWLYGATGSTVHSNINTSVSKDVKFEGQSIWRYHPEKEIFEIFAEGGGNTFHVEIDAKGRIYSGTNGTSRGQYYKQGAYYTKNWGKHGALTNDYAFGYLPDIQFKGEEIRFTHAWIKYEGGELPERYRGEMMAINPLQNFILLTHLEPNGSSFSSIDRERILATNDRWFRPVDIKAGPDGAIYLADWSDSRLSHVNPRDTWHKQSGRIYRIKGKDVSGSFSGDFNLYSTGELLASLAHKNKWLRQQALRQFGDRKDTSMVPTLRLLLKDSNEQTALEALWAIYQSGGWSEDIAREGMLHRDPYVRMWSVRLAADENMASPPLRKVLAQLIKEETHPEVISQLAASARRFPPEIGLQIFKGIAPKIDINDPDNPLMLWWAIASNIEGQHPAILHLFQEVDFWEIPVIHEVVIERLIQRTIMEGRDGDYTFATKLFNLAPNQKSGRKLLEGFSKGSIGVDRNTYPIELLDAMSTFKEKEGESALVQKILTEDIEAITEALNKIENDEYPMPLRRNLINFFAEHRVPGVVPALLKVVENRQSSSAIIVDALATLSEYRDTLIGLRILDDYPDHLRADVQTRKASLQTILTRRTWVDQLWNEIEVSRRMHASDLSRELVRQLYWMSEPDRRLKIIKLWPWYRSEENTERAATLDKIDVVLADGVGDLNRGKQLFDALCGSCHKLFEEGGEIGPDLTGYDRRDASYLALHIVDPDIDIREGYTNFGLRTQDDQYYMGIIQERSAKQVTIRTEAGIQQTFNMDQISTLEAQSESLMPEGLISDLPDSQIRDLFTYLMSE